MKCICNAKSWRAETDSLIVTSPKTGKSKIIYITGFMLSDSTITEKAVIRSMYYKVIEEKSKKPSYDFSSTVVDFTKVELETFAKHSEYIKHYDSKTGKMVL